MRTKGRQKISTGIYFVSLCIYTCILVGRGGGGGGVLGDYLDPTLNNQVQGCNSGGDYS